MEGEISSERENACNYGKAQLLKDQVAMDYEDIHGFFIESGLMKEKEEDGGTETGTTE